jgi:PAS domain S-box-containing protein
MKMMSCAEITLSKNTVFSAGTLRRTNMTVTPSYQLEIVMLSIIISLLSSYATFILISRAYRENIANRGFDLMMGSVISGAGIWTMHFIAMISFKPYASVSYNTWIMLFSLLIAIFFSLLSFSIILRPEVNKRLIYLCSTCLGLGIATTHYAAMGAISMLHHVDYNLIYVLASVLIAVTFSFAAIVSIIPQEVNPFQIKQNILKGTFLLAAAISGMHFTGMYAMNILKQPERQNQDRAPLLDGWITITADTLALWLGAFTLFFVIVIMVVAVRDRNKAEKQHLFSELKYRSLVENSPNIVIFLDSNLRVTELNPKGKEELGFDNAQINGMKLEELFREQDGVEVLIKELSKNAPVERNFTIETNDGRWIPMAITFIPVIIAGQLEGYFVVGKDISELFQYKERIRKVQKELLDTVRLQQGMIFKFINYNGQFIHTLGDGVLLRKLGLDTGKLMGRTLFDFLPYEQAEEKTKIYQQAWEGQVVHYEGNINGVDYFASLTPVIKDGQVIEVIGSAADITERKQIEALQKRNERWYRNILGVMTEGILLYDENDQMTVLNDNVYDMFEMDKETFHAQTLVHNEIEFIDENGIVLTMEQYPVIRTFRTGKSIKQKTLGVRKKDGMITWISTSTKLIEPTEPGDSSKVLLTFSDITLQKVQEMKLTESHALRKTILNSLPVGILVEDLHRNIVLANEVFRSLFKVDDGLLEMEGKGSSFYHLSLLPESERNQQHIDDIIQNQHPLEEEIATLDGRTLVRKYVPFYMDNELRGHLWMFEDYTERKRIMQESVFAKEEAIKANHAKSTFLSNMSHELRTPLNGILGFSQLLEIDDKLDAQQRLYVDEILKGGRHLLDLIKEILDLSRIETGRLKVSFKVANITSLIEECVNLIRPAAQRRNLSIEADLSDCLDLFVKIDEIRFRQVILNLLDNAVKYNRESGSIRIICSSKDGNLEIHVIDTGIGIEDDNLFSIFEPFYRIGHSNIEGAGIGLSLVKKLTILMEGNVGVVSECGKGSDFWISLPIHDQTDIMQKRQDETSPLLIQGIADKKILYVEDNASNIELMEQVMKQIPYVKLISAASGSEGIRLVSEEMPDMILLDIQLPDLSGFEVLEQLQSKGLLNEKPVIAISANAMPADVNAALEAGFTEYITKPINITHLLKSLAKYF